MNKNISQTSFERLTENSAEIYLYKHRVRTNVIYIVTVSTIAIIIILLPYINVDITVSARGNVRPITEKTKVTAIITELVDSVYIKEGCILQKGDIILTQRSLKNKNQQDYHKELIHDIESKLHDLQLLVKDITPSAFSSLSIHEDYNLYLSQRQQIVSDLEQYTIEWNRNKTLYDIGLISESEYNKYYYQYKSKSNELASLDSNQKSIWQNELYNLRKELKEYRSTDNELKADKDLYEVRSPVSGHIDQFSGIYKGSTLNAGQQIAVISPDASLCLEVYLKPRDIAFISNGQKVTIQVDALNYNEWGTLFGTVTDISSDMIEISNGNYYYRAKCNIDKDYLTLKGTNRKAFIKKGMSATAHFLVSRQSLFTLIYKNIDEWVNPTQYNQTK